MRDESSVDAQFVAFLGGLACIWTCEAGSTATETRMARVLQNQLAVATTTNLSPAEKRERVKDLMRHFDTAMLTTHTPNGGLRSRPLSIAHNDEDPMGLYFATAIDSPKVHELELNAGVNVSMQDKRRFVSVTGEARVILDRGLLERLWSETWRVWFPKGKNDPTLCIVVVEPREAAYWDMSGTEGISYLFEMAQAYVTGTKPTTDGDERHVGKVEL